MQVNRNRDNVESLGNVKFPTEYEKILNACIEVFALFVAVTSTNSSFIDEHYFCDNVCVTGIVKVTVLMIIFHLCSVTVLECVRKSI